MYDVYYACEVYSRDHGDCSMVISLPRTEALTTKLSRVERAIVEAAAVNMGLPRSAAMREMLVAAARQQLALEDPRPAA